MSQHKPETTTFHANRRTFLSATAASIAIGMNVNRSHATDIQKPSRIIDTHQHLWDLKKFRLPWLSGDSILNKTMHVPEYKQAIEGWNATAIYMEVDVEESQLSDEAKHVISLCDGTTPTIGAVIGGRPDSDGFSKYLDQFQENKQVKGVRRVLHSEATPAGYCLQEKFVAGVRELGKRGLSFDLCMRPGDLGDGVKLVDLCPNTRFVLDHLGNGHPDAFRKSVEKRPHSAYEWKAHIEQFAKRPNVICKISGVIASLPKGGDASDIAPLINHCLDSFGPDKVIFGSDWPVCLLGASLQTWLEYLTQIISTRKEGDRKKLWFENAVRFYGVPMATGNPTR